MLTRLAMALAQEAVPSAGFGLGVDRDGGFGGLAGPLVVAVTADRLSARGTALVGDRGGALDRDVEHAGEQRRTGAFPAVAAFDHDAAGVGVGHAAVTCTGSGT